MNEVDISGYLANVIAIARCDGILSQQEENAIENIKLEIGAKKKAISEANKLLEIQDYKPTPIGRYSTQIANLEDMIFVALADGELADSERTTIVSFAKQIQVTNEQLKKLVSDSRSRIKSINKSLKCPKCKAEISSSVKFCPECGTPIDSNSKSKSINVSFTYPKEGISIEFAESTSANFNLALKQASNAPNFQECLRGNKRWFLASWPSDQIQDIMVLIENLKGLRNRKAYFDRNEIAWDELFGFHWCAQQRKSAYRPIEYCFGSDNNQLNLWGCKQLHMDWTEWANWFSFGKFKNKDTFIFDIEKIKHEINVNLHKIRFCPYLRLNLIQEILKLLPTQVQVSKSSGWEYKEDYQESPNSIKVVVKEKYDGYTTTNEFYSDGVRPIGYNFAKEILNNAFKKCGITDIDIKAIIP